MDGSYLYRNIDAVLEGWVLDEDHKPLLLRGARQVGKTSVARHLGARFQYFAEVNFEYSPDLIKLFEGTLNVREICSKLEAVLNIPVREGDTLLFLDEIQACPRAIESLRYFREDMKGLHVIGAGSLLEFALEEMPTFAVGRIRSLYIYPLCFDEFLLALGEQALMEMKRKASPDVPVDTVLHKKLQELFRIYLMIGGMPEAVASWVKYRDYIRVARIQDDIVGGYETDFAKYKKRVSPDLLRLCMRGVVHSIGQKFVYSKSSTAYRSEQIKSGLRLLTMAGLIIPITHTAANGLPLDGETDDRYRKYLFLDPGLLLRELYLETGDVSNLTEEILTLNASELVNRGGLVEMVAGLEWQRYGDPGLRKSLYYWVRTERNSVAEIDYLILNKGEITPMEVKSGTKGGMKSMYMFLRQKGLHYGIRTSLENFGSYENDGLNIDVIPVYALSSLTGAYRSSGGADRKL